MTLGVFDVPVAFFSFLDFSVASRLIFQELKDPNTLSTSSRFYNNLSLDCTLPKSKNLKILSDLHSGSLALTKICCEVEIIAVFGLKNLKILTRTLDIAISNGFSCDKVPLKAVLVLDSAKNLFEYGVCSVDSSYTESKFIVRKQNLADIKTNIEKMFFLELRKPDDLCSSYLTSDFVSSFSIKVNNYVREVSHRVKQGSFLTPFMTFIYRLPYATHQKPIKSLIFNWMYYSGEVKDLEKAIDFLAKQNLTLTLTTKMRGALLDIVALPKIFDYIKALAEIRSGSKLKYVELGVNYKVEVYELNYIISVINGEDCFVIPNKHILFSSFFLDGGS